MVLQVLVPTMHQDNFQKYHEMNLSSDVIFANQTDKVGKEETTIDNCRVIMVSSDTRGVGINRNIAILHSYGDILLFGDDDLKYTDNYREIVERAFEENKQADGIIFNIDTIGNDMGRRKNSKISQLKYFNALNYGTPRLAIKRDSLLRTGVMFNLNFGGGTIYSSGEDSLFISDLLKKGMKIYTNPNTIATTDQTQSTWFNGYTEKYFYDKGALFKALDYLPAWVMILQDVVRHYRTFEISKVGLNKVIKLMRKGANNYSKLIPFIQSQGQK